MRKRALAMMMVAGISLMAPSCWCRIIPEICATPGCPTVELIAPANYPSQQSDRIRDLTQLWHKCCPDEANSWCAEHSPRNPDCTGNTPVYSRHDTNALLLYQSYTIPVHFHAWWPSSCQNKEKFNYAHLRVNMASISNAGNWYDNTINYYIEDHESYNPAYDLTGTLYFNVWYQRGDFTDWDDEPGPFEYPFNAVAMSVDYRVVVYTERSWAYGSPRQTKVMGPVDWTNLDYTWGGRREDNEGEGHYGASRAGGVRPHKAIDIAVNEVWGLVNVPVMAVSNGEVVSVNYEGTGYGCYVDYEPDRAFVMQDENSEDWAEDELIVRYNHLKIVDTDERKTRRQRCRDGEREEFGIEPEANLLPGQWIGYADRSGNYTTNMLTHLDFEIRTGPTPGNHTLDPEMFFVPFNSFHRCNKTTNTGQPCCTCSVVYDGPGSSDRCGW